MITPTLRSVSAYSLGLLPAIAINMSSLSDVAWSLWTTLLAVISGLHLLELTLLTPRRAVRFQVDAPPLLYLGDEGEVRFAFNLSGLKRALPGESYLALGGVEVSARPRKRFLINPHQPEAFAPRVDADEAQRSYGQSSPQEASKSAKRWSVMSFALKPKQRGVLTIDTLTLRWVSPLGLWRQTWTIPIHSEVPVVPNSRAVKALALQLEQKQRNDYGMKLQRLLGEGSEFDQLKEYMQGLDHRAIDWKASARHSKLLIRSFRVESNHQLYLAFDTGRLMSESLEGISRLDLSINAGLILSYISLKCGDLVGLCGFSDRVELFATPKRGVSSFGLVESRIAELKYHQTETNFTLAMLEMMNRLKRRSLVIVFTDFVDITTAEMMLESVRRLVKKHVVIFVSFKDQTLERFTQQAPKSLVNLNESVVAYNLMRERERVFSELKRCGVHCVEAEDEAIAPQLINQYLKIKKRELI